MSLLCSLGVHKWKEGDKNSYIGRKCLRCHRKETFYPILGWMPIKE